MPVYQLINNDNVKAGDHIVGRGEDQKVYDAEHPFVESDIDLVATFPGKFTHAPPGVEDSFSGQTATRPRARVPVTGLPSKRTPRPTGPEESGRTRVEVQEVAEAIETGEHEVEQRADPNPTEEPKKRKGFVTVTKVAPISKTARRGDIRSDEEEDDLYEEDRPVVSKSKLKKMGVKTKASEKEDASADEESTEETPKKKKKKSKKVKVKVTPKQKKAAADEEDE